MPEAREEVLVVLVAVAVGAAWTRLYYLAFPLGFAISFGMHYLLNRIWPPEGLGLVDDEDYYGTFTDVPPITIASEVLKGGGSQ